MNKSNRNGVRFLLIVAVAAAGVLLYIMWSPNKPVNTQQSQQDRSATTAAPHSTGEKQQNIDPSELEKLASLPYTDWSGPAADVVKNGVTQFDRQKAFDGLNLYNSRNLSKAHLMDMNGKIIHTWAVPGKDSWHTIKALKEGDLLALVKDRKVIRLGWDSGVKWEYKGNFHHEIVVSSNGLIYLPTRRVEFWKTTDFQIPVVKEYLTVLSQDGTFVKEIDLFDALNPMIPEQKIRDIRAWAQTNGVDRELTDQVTKHLVWWENKAADTFHLNSIELIERSVPSIAEKGDFLLSIRELNLICIFREGTGKLVWTWGPAEIQRQHHATLLDNGHILLFDNGIERGYSRVIEIDPATKRIVWEYRTPEAKDFFSFRRGAAQRIPNGNTLITESDRGRAFEVSPDGKIVWEFFNPDVHPKNKKRAIIYRLTRIPGSFITRNLRR